MFRIVHLEMFLVILFIVITFSNIAVSITESTTESTTVPTTYPSPPSIPANVSVVGVTSSSITISWTAPENIGGGITNYVIHYMSIVDDNNDTKRCNNTIMPTEQMNATLNNATTILLKNLQAWTLYQINVTANSSYGEGPSAVLTSWTDESVPEQPELVDIRNVSSTSVTLYWKEPCKPNGIITGYIVSYNITTRTANVHCPVEEQYMTFNVTGNVTFHKNIIDLYPWTTYMFCIAAQTTSGKGAEICKEQQTLQDFPEQPELVDIRNVSSTSVTFYWGEPCKPNGIITEYIVSYNITKRTANVHCPVEEHDMAFNVTGNVTFHKNITDLYPWTTYMFCIAAQTTSGKGAEICKEQQTLQDYPGKPGFVHTTSSSESVILVEWDQPCPVYGEIVYYDIKYTSINMEDDQHLYEGCLVNQTSDKIQQMDSNITSFNLTDLAYWTSYNICVSAFTTIGQGEENCTIEKTEEYLPGAINNLTVANITSRSVQICWQEPCPPNGNITDYVVNVYLSDGTQRNTTETKELCQVFEKLLPYKNYSFNVTAKTKVGEGVSQSISVETDTDVPFMPKDVRCFVMSSTVIKVSWQKGEYKTGPTNYSVSAIDEKNNATKFSCSTKGFEHNTCKITSLDEFWNYTIEVTASTDKGSSISETCFNQTKEDAPGYVEFFNVSQIDDLSGPRQVIIIWRPPTEREQNGIIASYNISWTPEGGQVNSTDVAFDHRNLTVEVKSSIQYTFAIHAVTIIPGKGNESGLFIQPGVPNKPRENASYPLIQHSVEIVDEPQRQIAVTLLPKTVLCGDTNGKPTGWGVIVSSDEAAGTGDPYSGSRTTYTKKKRYNTTWHLAFKQRPVSPYRVTNETWQPKSCSGINAKSATASVFVVGTDDACSPSDGYCNGYLDPGQLYRVKVFWCTDTACTETEYSLPIATAREEKESSQDLPVIIGSVAGSTLAFIVIGIVSIYIWRRQLACFRKRLTKAEDGEVNLGFEAKYLKNKREKRPVRLSDFHTHFETLSENSNLLLSKAYQELNAASPKFSTSDSELEETRMKNRYTNILSFNKTRVKLVGADDEPGSDYINANYIPGCSSGREYIATQGPLTSTINDFWRMIWEQNASIIIMLTQCTERGRKKCEQYWPKDISESLFYDDIVVQMESESHLPDFILRTFVLRLGDIEKRVRHYYYLLWPDMGIPASTDYMLKFVDTVRRDIKPDMIGPIVVHCSAGVGRTGTYIILDTIIRKIQSGEDHVDIFGDILNIRNCRMNMVQTEIQFIYIHKCIHDYLMPVGENENLSEPNQIYENLSTLYSYQTDTPGQ